MKWLDTDLELDRDTNWGKFLDPDPNINYLELDPQHHQKKFLLLL